MVQRCFHPLAVFTICGIGKPDGHKVRFLSGTEIRFDGNWGYLDVERGGGRYAKKHVPHAPFAIFNGRARF